MRVGIVSGRNLVLRLGGERVSLRFEARGLLVGAILVTLGLLLAAFALTLGTYPIALHHVGLALLGQGDEMERMIVAEWRLPRVVLALLLGAALGSSGAVFQSLTRNPLGSPDVIGFSAGSYTGALVVILSFGGGYAETALGALFGGTLTAAAVYLLAWRGGMQGFRLIIVGIGVAAMLSALNAWMIRSAELQVALSAAIWGAGSLNGLGPEQLGPVAVALGLLLPPTILLGPAMRQLELGDDFGRATGVHADRVRLGLTLLGVALTALATAAAGPIAFISLCAPQIARRLTGVGHVALVPAALVGALLLLVADAAAQHALPVQLPVGVMTVSLGGVYFLWLLLREGHR